MWPRYLRVVILLFASTAALAQEAAVSKTPAGPRQDAFSVGISGQRHSLKAGNGNEILGNSAVIQLGKGYIADTWFWNASFDIHLGPYEPTRGRQLEVDYFGTGLSLWAGTSAQNSNLRSQEGGYGFALGLSYADVVGRSLGRNRFEQGDPSALDNQHLIDNYVLRVTNFSLLPAIFFCWLNEARPTGNTPELLETRLEGFILTVGMSMPLLVSYKAQFDTRTQRDPGGSVTAAANTARESGQMRGYSIVVALTAMLGT